MTKFTDEFSAFNSLITGLGNTPIAAGNSFESDRVSQWQKMGGIFNLGAIANGQSLIFNSSTKTFTPATFAPISHTHAIANVTNLQSTLDLPNTVAALSGASVSIDSSSGNFFTLTLPQNTTISSIATSKSGISMYLSVTQDSTGNRTLTFPNNVTVTGAIDHTANSNSVVRLVTFNSGTTWEAIVIKPMENMIYPPVTVTITAGATTSTAFAIPGKIITIDAPITAAAKTVTLEVLGADGNNWISSGITWQTSTSLNTLVNSEALTKISGMTAPNSDRFRLSIDSSLGTDCTHFVRSRT